MNSKQNIQKSFLFPLFYQCFIVSSTEVHCVLSALINNGALAKQLRQNLL